MIDKDDWRLRGQKEYLAGVSLTRKRYSRYRQGWDHDHCAFCWVKFMEVEGPDAICQGYATQDNYHWICPQCFDDFKAIFQWDVIS